MCTIEFNNAVCRANAKIKDLLIMSLGHPKGLNNCISSVLTIIFQLSVLHATFLLSRCTIITVCRAKFNTLALSNFMKCWTFPQEA